MSKATFSVKNFEQFQHYRNRNPIWIKLYNSLLEDYEFGLLPDATKAHLLAIWLLASRYQNAIPLDGNWVSQKINATTTVDLSLLEKAGFIQYNQVDTSVLATCYQSASPEKRRETSESREDISSLRSDIPAKRKLRHSLPVSFPEESGKEWATEFWLQRGRADLCGGLDDQVQQFRDHHAGRLTASADWSASWRTWVRNAVKFSNGGHNGKSRKPTAHDNFIEGALLAAKSFGRGEDSEG